MPFLQTLSRLARTIGGLIAGSILSSAVATVIDGSGLSDPDLPPKFLPQAFNAAFFVFMFALPVGLIGHAILYALKRREIYYYAGLGAIGGGLFGYFINKSGDVFFHVQAIVSYAIWAGACAAIAWLVRRPDKDEPKTPDPASHF